jgi:hypothetical protein
VVGPDEVMRVPGTADTDAEAGPDMGTPAAAVVVSVRSPLGPDAVAELCARLRGLVRATGVAVVTCDVEGVPADVAAVDALARMALTARRLGCTVRLRHAGDDLRGLLALAGLDGILPCPRDPDP